MATFFGEITLYECFAPAVINGDYDDLNAEEETELTEFLRTGLASYFNASEAHIYEVRDDSYFGRPEAVGNLVGSVCTYEVCYTV
jgi:hypothetical protein